jgi:hypothetical protein
MIQLIRGFKDILPGEVELWQAVEKVARELLEDFGFKEIRIPIMERTELFARPCFAGSGPRREDTGNFIRLMPRSLVCRPGWLTSSLFFCW